MCLHGNYARRKLLNFVVVGGGPTGVEFSAELHDLIHEDLLSLYPDLGEHVHITLVQSGDHILNTFDERISKYAEQKFARDGVHVKIGCRVLGVTDEFISFKSKTGQLVDVPYGMIVWSTGKLPEFILLRETRETVLLDNGTGSHASLST